MSDAKTKRKLEKFHERLECHEMSKLNGFMTDGEYRNVVKTYLSETVFPFCQRLGLQTTSFAKYDNLS